MYANGSALSRPFHIIPPWPGQRSLTGLNQVRFSIPLGVYTSGQPKDSAGNLRKVGYELGKKVK